jgi:hypothetical protein
VENWSLPDGQTLDVRAEVVSLSQDASGAGLGIGTGSQRFYKFGLHSDRVVLDRWEVPSSVVSLINEPVTLRQTNVVLSLALTRRGSQAVVTVRVLDKANGQLYCKGVTDSTPYFSGNNLVIAVEPRRSLSNPSISAVFDNFQLLKYDVPRVEWTRALQLAWPTTAGMSFQVEGAPTPDGPWLPVPDSTMPGFEQQSIPQIDMMKFLRLRQSP